MSMSSDRDDLIARVAALEPARGTPRLSRRTIRSLVRATTATPWAARTWTRPRYRLASLGALVGSGALAVAAFIGLESVGPSLPAALTSAVRTTSHPPVPSLWSADVQYSSQHGSPDATGFTASASCPVALQVRGAASVPFPPGPRQATAYRIASLLSPPRALLALAPVFGLATARVKWFSSGAHARGWWVGTLSGPSLTTYAAAGITWWSYVGPREASQHLIPESVLDVRHQSDATSVHDAMRLLSRLGAAGTLGSPTTQRSPASVQVSFPLSVHGVVTDEHYIVTYYPGRHLAAADGPLTAIVRGVTYPTVTPLTAVQLLRRPQGALVALAPPTSTSATGTTTTSGRHVSTLYCGAMSSLLSVTNASMTLTTKELSDGSAWLLPSWTFSRAVPQGGTYGRNEASSVAINPRYLDYLPAKVHLRVPKGTR
jgi:hypothetical protein